MQFTILAAAAGLLTTTTVASPAAVLARDCVIETCFNALVTDVENSIPSCATALLSEGTSILSDAECLFSMGEDAVTTAPVCSGCWGQIVQYAEQKAENKTMDVVSKVESAGKAAETKAKEAWDDVKDFF